jgi:hypothetical protein
VLIRTKAVVVPLDSATGLPPAHPPVMRVQRLDTAGTVDVDWPQKRTLGGAVVFGEQTDAGTPPAREDFRLVVEAGAVFRPESPKGYPFTVGADPARWPVRLLVRLLPGPSYSYPPRTPVVRGTVVAGGPGPVRAPVPDAVVEASVDGGGTVSNRCGADHQGGFALGLPSYRPSRATVVRARSPSGAQGSWRAVLPADFDRTVQLTVQ